MELSYNTENLEIELTVTEDNIFCEYGELEFSFAEDAAIVNSINVYLKRSCVGTRLVNSFEILARKNKLKRIEVPACLTNSRSNFILEKFRI